MDQAGRKERLALFDGRAPHLDAASWEDLCRMAVPRLAASLGGEFGPAGRYWSGSGPEWDVVAKASVGNQHLLGEVKWTTAPMTAAGLVDVHGQLLGKGLPPCVRGEVVHALFVPVLPPKRPRALPANVRLVDAKAVIAALR